MHNIRFEDDLYDTLERIRSLDYNIGVISNAFIYDEIMIKCFEKANLKDLIDTFTFSYSIRYRKPLPEIFNVAFSRAGVDVLNSMMVGDNLRADIEPARRHGLRGVWYNPGGAVNDTTIVLDFEINRLNELLDII